MHLGEFPSRDAGREGRRGDVPARPRGSLRICLGYFSRTASRRPEDDPGQDTESQGKGANGQMHRKQGMGTRRDTEAEHGAVT